MSQVKKQKSSNSSVQQTDSSLKRWAVIPAEDILTQLDTNISTGLNQEQVRRNQQQYGYNELTTRKAISAFEILVEQFKSSVVVLLLVAAGISFVSREFIQGGGILVAVIVNAAVGFFMEVRAKTSLEDLARLSGTTARVRREGKEREVLVRELVPGDIVILEAGSKIPADIRWIETVGVSADESPMTGESVPVFKSAELIGDVDTFSTLGFQGTLVAGGRGLGAVVATGDKTRLGDLGHLVATTEAGTTPLKIQLARLGRQLSMLTVVSCVGITAIGILHRADTAVMIQTGIALAVAAIPEGLPVLATLALAIGTQRMVQAKTLIRHLAAVETLGSTTVICTDKTGTLTENQMLITDVVCGSRHLAVSGRGYEPEGEFSENNEVLSLQNEHVLRELLQAGTLCSDTSIALDDAGRWLAHGDPTEGALVAAAAKAGLTKANLEQRYPRLQEFAFDLARKRMTTVHQIGDKRTAYVKGSPETLLNLSTFYFDGNELRPLDERTRTWLIAKNVELAGRGLRVLGIAKKEHADITSFERDDVESALTLLGLVGMSDQAKDGVKEALEKCQRAGIRVVMLTGDQAATAIAIARELGIRVADSARTVITGDELESLTENQLEEVLKTTAVIARVTPKMKLSIVQSLQLQGEIVAMTGDGINDAPALKQAHIGIAMGKRGTDMAREASQMVITDDSFASIVKAIEQGRIIYKNIQQAIEYLLTASTAAVSTIAVGVIFNTGLPLTPLQLLWLNLIMHIFPGLAIVLQPGNSQIMLEKPRDPKANLLGRTEQVQIWTRSIVVSLAVLLILEIHFRISGNAPCVTTVGLAAISSCLLLQAWSWIDLRETIFPKLNVPVMLNMAIAYLLLVLAIVWPMLWKVLGTTALDKIQVLYIVLVALASYVLTIFIDRLLQKLRMI